MSEGSDKTLEATGGEHTSADEKQSSKPGSAWWKPLLLLAAVGTILVLAKVFDIGGRLGDLRQWIDSLGVWGPAVFILLYTVAVVAALPGSALTVIAGALFGSVWGVVVVSIGATLGASLAFLVARYFARASVTNWLSKNKRFRHLDELTKKQGAIMVALTRLVPLFPFNLLNYGFGLTGVSFWTYVFWSWLCMLPGTVLYVVGADAVAKGLAQGGIPWVLVGALIAAAVIVAVLVGYARRRLKDDEVSSEAE